MENKLNASEDSKETGRTEAFSDGVIAIAITLLVLELKAPVLDGKADTSFFKALGEEWPSFLGFFTSFLTVLVMWINHHRLFTHIKRTDTIMLLFNGLLLMGISLVPFTTKLVTDYLKDTEHPEWAQGGAIVYNGFFVVISIFFNLLWRWSSYNNRLLDPNTNLAAVKAISQQYSYGVPAYLVAFGLSLINVPASLILTAIMAVFFAIPGKQKMSEV
jgi:uncharacterized membrane protein